MDRAVERERGHRRLPVARRLSSDGHKVKVLDGDALRKKVSKDLGFSKKDRMEHIRRAALLASELTHKGYFVLAALISPYRLSREAARRTIGSFIEIHTRCPLSVCEKRDRKGMYRQARKGNIKKFTGVSDIYEAPSGAEIVLDTHRMTIRSCVKKTLDYLRCQKHIPVV